MSSRDALAVQQNAAEVGRNAPRMLEGVVISGSWDPANATVQVLVGDTIPFENVNFNSSGLNQPFMPVCTVCSPIPYDQAGPVGGERVQIWEANGGGFAWYEAGPDDSPQAPAGERFIMHRSAANPNAVVFDAGIQLTNDGPTTGDQLGGTLVGYQGALTALFTKGGWVFSMGDTHLLGTLQAPDGTIVQIDANAHKVYLGANGLGASNAVMTAQDVQNALNALASDLKTWANANFQTGTNTAVAPSVPTASGSTKVFAED